MNQIFRSNHSFQDRVNQLFRDSFAGQGENSALTTWAPSVDIYETENELVIKADLPDVSEKDLDVRIENNTLTVRGERKFDSQVSEDKYLRIERAYGGFSRKASGPPTRMAC
jgi:HSP20 family protein